MPYLFIRHVVEDYDTWRPVYDGHEPARLAAGLRCEGVFQQAGEPNDIVLIFDVRDEEKARQFLQSEDLRLRMEQAGVIRGPWIHFARQREMARL